MNFPNDREKRHNNIIFNQSGVELGLLAPCLSRVFPRLENGAGELGGGQILQFCDVAILYLCQWDFFQYYCHDKETILQHRLTLWVLLVFSSQVCYKKRVQANKLVYKKWIPNSYFSLNYRRNLTLGQKLKRTKNFLQCSTQLAMSLTERLHWIAVKSFLLFADSCLLRRTLTDHSFSCMLGRLSILPYTRAASLTVAQSGPVKY